MKVSLLTAASKEYWPILQLTAPNKLEYSLKHDIQFTTRLHEDFDVKANEN